MRNSVVIVGSGPVGAVLALGLARHGFGVVLLEAQSTVPDAPRAATMHPSTLEMLGELGLMQQVVEEGLVARYFDFWDRPTRSLIARFDHDILRGVTPFPFVVQLEQHKLVNMALRELATIDNAQVHFDTAVTAVRQDADGATAIADHDGELVEFHGDYVVGADGGRSVVRKSLGIEFVGYTWPERFLVLTTGVDFQADLDCSFRNYLADPVEWTNLFKVAGDDGKGRWRAVFSVPATTSDEDALGDEAVRGRLHRLTANDGAMALLEHRNIYKVHQRVAGSVREGRVLLMGDAAHVNNPIGGLGLNSGIHDATDLIATLTAMGSHYDDDALGQYGTRRRELNVEFVQQQTIANKKRLEETDPEVRKLRQDELAATVADPERARRFLLRSSLLDSVRRSRP